MTNGSVESYTKEIEQAYSSFELVTLPSYEKRE
jgi:hypothetical protein